MNRREVFKSMIGAGLAPIIQPEVLKKPAIVYGIVLDESGSMSNLQEATIKGFNQHIAQLKKDAPSNVETRLFVVIFQTTLTRAALNIPLEEMPELTDKDYIPGAFTALYDAIGFTMSEMEKIGGDDTSYLLTVISDGYENSSKEWTGPSVKERIESAKKTGKWTVSYIGTSDINFRDQAADIAVTAGSMKSFDKNPEAVAVMYAQHTESFGKLSATRSVTAGNVSMTNFYEES